MAGFETLPGALSCTQPFPVFVHPEAEQFPFSVGVGLGQQLFSYCDHDGLPDVVFVVVCMGCVTATGEQVQTGIPAPVSG